MNRTKTFVYVAVELLLILVVALTLVVVIRSYTSRRSAKSPLAQSLPSTPTVGETVDQPYPPPVQTVPTVVETPEPTRVFILVGTEEYAAPTVFHPTFTPYPTPTQLPGGTSTPFPLVQPAKNAAGTILYIARPIDGADKEIMNIAVDGTGIGKSVPTLDWSLPISDGFVYPSPDGRQMVIVHHAGEADVFYLLDINSGKVDPLIGGRTVDKFFGWYPDSRHVLVGPNGGLVLWNIYDFNEYVLLAVPEYMSIDGAAASPDGQKVVYYSSNDFSSIAGVWMVDADGRNAHLVFKSSSVWNFSWSPDGRHIALNGGRMVIDADGSNLRELDNFDDCGYPRWSPDSLTLAIVTSNSTEMDPCSKWSEDIFKSADILLVDVGSGKSHSLLPDGVTGNIDPAWSPDGKQISFVTNRSGAPEIWIVNADGTNLRQLTSDGEYKRFTYWRRP